MRSNPLKGGTQRLRLAFVFAVQTVRNNARRMLLAVLGVAIGIAAVVSMLSIGHSVTAQATRALERLGADVVTLALRPVGSAQADAGGPQVDRAEFDRLDERTDVAARIVRNMAEVKAVSKVSRLNSCGGSDADPLANIGVIAAGPELIDVLSLTLSAGRFSHPLDGTQLWVVLGSEALQALRRVQPGLQIGSPLSLCGKTFFIAGVLEPYFGDDLLTLFKMNNAMLLSYPAAGRLAQSMPASQLLVRMRQGAPDMADSLMQRLQNGMAQPSQAMGARQVSELKREQVSLYTRFLAVLGGVALLVGSLGITNVMLASVAERKAEIGLRMALGASTADVVLQFLVESVLICAGGALLGLLLGSLGAAGALALGGIDYAFDVTTPLFAALLAVVSGLAAGAYPAARAARLDPVETLQGHA